MMSNAPSSLQTRQGLHRRQNSTPVALEAMKVHHPTTIHRQSSQHKRGQSYDSRSPIRRQPTRTGSTVSITNLGSMTNGQQILREAQQQRTARPGQFQPNELPVSPQCGLYQSMTGSALQGSPYDQMTMDAIMQNMQNMQGMTAHPQLIPHDIGIPMPDTLGMGFDLDENNQHYFSSQNHVSLNMGMMPFTDRRMSQPELRIHTALRPLTPTQQAQTAQFPLTPATTPFRQGQFVRIRQHASTRKAHDENIRSPYPVSMQKSKSLQGIMERDEATSSTSAFEVAEVPTRHSLSMKIQANASNDQVSLQTDSNITGDGSAQGSTDEETLPFFDENGGETLQLDDRSVPVLASNQGDREQSPSRAALSPRRMSISDLNLEPGISASIEETNITLDDIAQFIEGPDSVDNKWICKYEECNKRFGRKENIKSHVQTHLGDRQFKCDHCQKCFVRGHDLKRHAKIHTGTKPYPCLCGNAFARHDALTRHRQRGMCIGAFDGIVKKVIKRGRPRKHRPDMDDRLDKAGKSRRNQAASENDLDQFESSASSCSMSSWGSPPTESMDHLSIRGQSPYDDINLFGLQPSQIMSFPPDVFTFTPPASPGWSTGNKPSPYYRELTPSEIASIAGDLPPPMVNQVGDPLHTIPELPIIDTRGSMLSANPMTIQHSQQSLPGLSHSSSSPAADIAAFDFCSDDPTMSSVHNMEMAMQAKMDMMTSERNDFDTFLDYGGMEIGLDNTNADPFFTM